MPDQKTSYKVIGLMSGTSMDGLDICFCELATQNQQWGYSIIRATTVPYDETWLKALKDAPQLYGEQLTTLDNAFGNYCGEQVNRFVLAHDISADLIASHGHTIFHRPDLGYTLQIGSGAAIAATTGLTTVCDFRSQDVHLGGQGAPLVPIGDRLLFGEYDFCLNIGGFSNISFESQGKRVAYDISPANIVLNALANRERLDFDAGGQLAQKGQIIPALLENLNALAYYQKQPPKSLGREWVNTVIEPQFKAFRDHPTADLLRTFTEHIAKQIICALPEKENVKLIASGGGALNSFLIQRIREQSPATILVAGEAVLHYKEALIFALLGVLRLRGEHNCLASVTGAVRDHCSGCIYPGKE